MKKIISSKSWLLINLSGTLCFGCVFVYGFCMLLQSVISKSPLWSIFFLLSVFSLLILALFIVALNRLSCIVWYDGTSIGRRGLLFGFKHQLAVREIEDVVIVTVPKQARYVVVIDNYCSDMEGLSKRSYIRFEHTEKTKEFYELLRREKIIKRD